MDLRQLGYLVAVAEENSFTKAAARCRIAQSAMSAQIARLEDELSARLFDRTSRSVRLTPAGELLLRHAYALLRAADVARAEMAAYTGILSGRLRIGMVGGAVGPGVQIQEALVSFHQRHPDVEILVHDTGSRQMADDVRAGELDLAFVSLYADQVPDGLAHRLLFDEPLVAVVARTHVLADRASATLAELAAAGPFIDRPKMVGARLQVDEAFARAGVERTVAFEFSAPQAVERFVTLGLGVALIPAVAAERMDPNEVTALSLKGCRVGHPIALIHAAPEPSTPSARAFVALLAPTAADLAPPDRRS